MAAINSSRPARKMACGVSRWRRSSALNVFFAIASLIRRPKRMAATNHANGSRTTAIPNSSQKSVPFSRRSDATSFMWIALRIHEPILPSAQNGVWRQSSHHATPHDPLPSSARKSREDETACRATIASPHRVVSRRAASPRLFFSSAASLVMTPFRSRCGIVFLDRRPLLLGVRKYPARVPGFGTPKSLRPARCNGSQNWERGLRMRERGLSCWGGSRNSGDQ